MKNRKTIITIISGCILFFLLCLPDLIFYIQQKSPIQFIYSLLVPLLVFSIPLLFVRRIVKWYFLFICIFILLAPVATFPVIYFGDLVGKDMLVITFNSNFRETSELIRGYLPLFLLIYIIYLFFIVLFFRRLPKRVSLKPAIIISVISFILLITLTLSRFGTGSIGKNTRRIIYNYYPFQLVYSGYTFYKQELLVKHAEKYLKKFHFIRVNTKPLEKRQVYVLIIGESARYDHWEINGYSRPTSPHLMQVKNLLDFRDAAAGGVITELSVPQILTGVKANTYESHLRRGGLLTLFNQAGYRTYWLTNQTDKGDIRVHSVFADTRILIQNTDGSDKHLHYDMELVNDMKSLLAKNDSNSLVIIHCIGSHYTYTSRYPSSYEYFKPVYTNQLSTPTEISNKDELINAYDNTILYTDAVIDSVIQVVRNLDCISAVIYSSDHGENLFDNSSHLVLHAPAPPNRFIAHIPFFIYCSQHYREQFPEKWHWLNSHVDDPISNNQIFETLADMAGIGFKGQDLQNSIADSLFQHSSQEILGPDSKVYYYKRLPQIR